MYTDKILNTAYSFAAAIVVFGAWAKLEHKEFGSLALTIGMLVESGIFMIYGIVGWRESSSTALTSSRVSTLDDGPSSTAGESAAGEVGELQQTMEQTNSILRKIFRAGEV